MTSWVAGNAVLAMAGPTGRRRGRSALVLYGGLYPLAAAGPAASRCSAPAAPSGASGLLDTTIRVAAVGDGDVGVRGRARVRRAARLGGNAGLGPGTGPSATCCSSAALARLGTIAGGRGTDAPQTRPRRSWWPSSGAAIAAELTGSSPVVALIPLDARWLPGLVAIGLVALHPSMRLLTTASAERERVVSTFDVVDARPGDARRSRRWWSGGAATNRPPDSIAIATFATALMVLVAARTVTMARRISRQASRDDLTGLPNPPALHAAAVPGSRTRTPGRPCCCSTWTGSRRSTTRSATRPGTSC